MSSIFYRRGLILPGHSKAIGKDDEGSFILMTLREAEVPNDLKFPFSSWVIASTPQNAVDANGDVLFPEATLFDSLIYGMNRAKIAWYTIDPFVSGEDTARPDHLTADDVSNHYLVEIQQQEIFPQADIAVTGLNNLSTLTWPIIRMNAVPIILMFPELPLARVSILMDHSSTRLPDGGGIMRNLETNDFEAANIETIEFWVMDPFDNLGPFGTQVTDGGDLYINIGNVSKTSSKTAGPSLRMVFQKMALPLILTPPTGALCHEPCLSTRHLITTRTAVRIRIKDMTDRNDAQGGWFYADYLTQLQNHSYT